MSMVKTNYTLTVYKNTGFNFTDIPADATLLELCDKQVYNDTYFLREDLDNPVIRVNDAYRNLSDVDYVKLEASGSAVNNQPTVFYYFAVPHADAGGTTSLTLDLDALLTCGGCKNLDYISGWQVRGHIAKADDTLFGNIAPEDWFPSQVLITKGFEEFDGVCSLAADEKIIISNIDIAEMGKRTGNEVEAIKGVILQGGSVAEEVMYFPKIPVCGNSSVFCIWPTDTQGNSFGIPNTMAFDANNANVKNGLNYLFSCGQLQLTNSYTLAKEYIDALSPDNDGRVVTLTGVGHNNNKTMSNFPFEYTDDGYTPKNKKCYALYRAFTLANIASSASMTKDAHELKHGSDTCPVIHIWADLSSTGKPYARFISDTLPESAYINAVVGAPWVTHQLLLEGASGNLWNTIQNAYACQTLDRNESQIKLDRAYTNQTLENNLIGVDIARRQQLAGTAGNIFGGIAGGAIAGGKTPEAMAVGGGVAVANTILSIGLSDYARENAMSTMKLANEQQNMHYDLDIQRLRQERNENRIGMLKSNGLVAPTVMFTPEPNLAMYGYNKFVLYETRLSKADLMSLDDYLQRYGYSNLNRKLTKQCFDMRNYYSYVQAFDVNFKVTGKSIGLRIRNKAISQLNNGVRVWKVLPDASYYETN